MGELLERELAGLRPVATRRPNRQLAVLLAVSLVAAAALTTALTLRRDLELLPRVWLLLYCLGWAIAFIGLSALAVLPRRGQVMPAWRVAGTVAAGAGGGFVIAGLLLSRTVPGMSSEVGASGSDLWHYGRGCLATGVAGALAPVALGILFLRRAIPVGPAWVGAALGAGGGALGGLVLHLHCPITHPTHLGLVHGGAVVVSALLGALAARRLLRP
jgi:hypothetical protein